MGFVAAAVLVLGMAAVETSLAFFFDLEFLVFFRRAVRSSGNCVALSGGG